MTLLLSALLSEFHMVKSDAKLANAFRYREGKNDYYLCAGKRRQSATSCKFNEY